MTRAASDLFATAGVLDDMGRRPPRPVTSLRRPIVRYFGGKWHMAPWIASFFPPHDVYVEPFGGGASVLMRKPKSKVEVLNDLDDDVVALYRTLADEATNRDLALRCYLSKFKLSDLQIACLVRDDADDLDRAHRLVVRGALARNSALHISTGSRAGIRQAEYKEGRGTTPAQDFATYRHSVPAFHRRLKDVVIHQEDAVAVMRRYDAEGVLHYCDPPYLPAARRAPQHGYRHELTAGDHDDLLDVLRSLKGFVALSGYSHPVYEAALVGWTRLDRVSIDNGGSSRVESLWLNPAAVEATMAPAVRQLSLF